MFYLASPLYLLFLPLIAIPPLLNLFKRHLRVVSFPDLRLIDEVESVKTRKIKIKEILKTIIRMLLIASLVIALCGPFLAEEKTSEVYVIIDDSSVMASTMGGDEPLMRAKELAVSIVESFARTSGVHIITLSDPYKLVSPAGKEEAQLFIDELGIDPVFFARDVSLDIALSGIDDARIFYLSSFPPGDAVDVGDRDDNFVFCDCGGERVYIRDFELTVDSGTKLLSFLLEGLSKDEVPEIEIVQGGETYGFSEYGTKYGEDYVLEIPHKDEAGYLYIKHPDIGKMGSYIFWGSIQENQLHLVEGVSGYVERSLGSFVSGYNHPGLSLKSVELSESVKNSSPELIVVDINSLSEVDMEVLSDYIESEGGVLLLSSVGDFRNLDRIFGGIDVEQTEGGVKRRYIYDVFNNRVGFVKTTITSDVEGEGLRNILITGEGEEVLVVDEKDNYVLLLPLSPNLSSVLRTALFPYILKGVIEDVMPSTEVYTDDAFSGDMEPQFVPEGKPKDEDSVRYPGLYKVVDEDGERVIGVNLNYGMLYEGWSGAGIEVWSLDEFEERLSGEVGASFDLTIYFIIFAGILALVDLGFLSFV